MTNRELKEEIVSALDWEPSIDAGEIAVAVDDNVVTLSGKARNAAEKDLAAKLVTDINGVKSVVNNMTIDESMSKNN